MRAAGEYSERIKIYRAVADNAGRLGELRDGYAATPFALRWAKVEPIAGAEGEASGGQGASLDYWFRMPLCETAKTSDRILRRGLNYSALEVKHDRAECETSIRCRVDEDAG